MKFIKLLSIFFFLFISCKKNDNPKTTYNDKKEVTGNVKHNHNSEYKTWYFSSLNFDKSYKNFTILISNDSIKILNANHLKCQGEIVQEKTTFKKYFKSDKTANEIREKLGKDYNLNTINEIIVISNANGDLTEEGCLFPFNELFVVDNKLFFYDKQYYCFASTEDKKLDNQSNLESVNIQLPYSKKIDVDNVKYYMIKENLIKGLDDFSCGDQEVRYLPLLSKNNINLILVPQDCGDFPYRFYLLTIKDNKVISNLYVEGEWGEPEQTERKTITTFSIDEKYIIEIQTIEIYNGKIESKEFTKYKINQEGIFVKS
ncbi:hypothetical protein [Flavobacterium saccharophilum]|uniref:Uncharacterized protein n=1 Tax=Flavobacterium saccharophilum TaxID=29534 RepID=A0A1M7MCK8_9FLAO|nr:hypothetical protein [Flavobacterium saccharophilum]SHM88075.1 hypothetical protein SAMN05444366_4456 [Flavobacterium saccharophilum]